MEATGKEQHGIAIKLLYTMAPTATVYEYQAGLRAYGACSTLSIRAVPESFPSHDRTRGDFAVVELFSPITVAGAALDSP